MKKNDIIVRVFPIQVPGVLPDYVFGWEICDVNGQIEVGTADTFHEAEKTARLAWCRITETPVRVDEVDGILRLDDIATGPIQK